MISYPIVPYPASTCISLYGETNAYSFVIDSSLASISLAPQSFPFSRTVAPRDLIPSVFNFGVPIGT